MIDPENFEIINFNDSIFDLFNFEAETSSVEVIKWLSDDNNHCCKAKLTDVAQKVKKDKSVSYLCLGSKVSGEDFWSENTLSVFEYGEKVQYVLVIRDIQEQKLMEESLSEAKDHFQNLAENSPDVIMRFDRKYRHLYVNQAIIKQIGILPEQFLNKTHGEMGVFPEDLVIFWEGVMNKVFEEGRPHTVEFELPSKSGNLSIEWRIFPESDENGNIPTILAIARDITEANYAKLALSKSEERLTLAVDATSLGLWDWDLQSNQVYYSPIYFSMLGYENDEFAHEWETWHKLMHEDDREFILETVEKCITNKDEDFEVEFRLLCKDGSYKWIQGKGRVTEVGEDGTIWRVIGTHEDISERKRNEKIQEMLFFISNAVNTTKNLEELYEKIRDYLGVVIDTTNCFLALYHEESNMLTMPFHRDEVDSFNEFPAGKTLTGYVISTGKAQLVDANREARLTEEGFIEPVGSPCVSWLGVPFKTNSKTIGVFVVQSYNEEVIFTSDDVSILEFVSDQIALAIERKRDQDN
ncbi:MAG: PAS domain S-box protein, partial [Bacteroidales bacterium]|nr:PAS domain S-box protein [Bacteroidales bacterium]